MYLTHTLISFIVYYFIFEEGLQLILEPPLDTSGQSAFFGNLLSVTFWHHTTTITVFRFIVSINKHKLAIATTSS